MTGLAVSEQASQRWRPHQALAEFERFIPASRISRTLDHLHARLFLLSHSFGPVIGLALCAFLVINGFPVDYRLIGFGALICLFWAYPFALRAGVRYSLLSLVSLQHLILAIFWAGFGYGGFTSPFLLWLTIVPLLAFLYLAPNYRLWLGLLAMLALNLALFALAVVALPTPPPASPHAMGWLGLLSMLSASAYVAMMAVYFGHVLTSRADIEQEVMQHRATAAALAEAAAEIRRAGDAKAEFVARMSHELRAPLNAVIGYGQMLLEDSQAHQEYAVSADLESITGAGQYLITLVDDVLDYSRIEAGAVELQPVETDLPTLIGKIAEQIRPLAEQRGNRLNVDAAPGTVHTDAALLEKALMRVARHCAQSTSQGWIELRAWAEGADSIIIEIGDDGPPIPPARLASLFDPLDMQSDAGTTKYGGHGIGLALARRICTLLGGTIDVTSERSRGSRFRITLPRRGFDPAPISL